MTRPSIVRADTIDLQDQDNPSAAAHHKRPSQEGLAPHQAAQVHHVNEERHSEEQVLVNAWNISDNLTDNPDAIHQAQLGPQDRHMNGGHHNDDESDSGEAEHDVDDDMMDRISSSPSIDEEDINFEFVYALHTFVATVEGQANATKGDTMVLLDDSNSYWWLVRVVKDNSIGYLPAEHIETPTERLARLNKHRNVDLTHTMLSDNAEKSRNPLRNVMRRRNAKTVSFAPPTFVEASDYDYDTDEEDDEPEDIAVAVQGDATEAATTTAALTTTTDASATAATAATTAAAAAMATATTATSSDGTTAAHSSDQSEQDKLDDDFEAKTTPQQKEKQSKRASFDREQAATATTSSIDPELSPRLVDKTEAAPLKSRKGTPRNTDSFLKDDSIETRKITLTPGLLREDNSSTKSDSSEMVRGNSLDAIVKQITPPEAVTKKDSKRDKKDQKKPSMLSGLFKSKKKDKKNKAEAGDQSDTEKLSAELARSDTAPTPSTYLTSGQHTQMTSSPAMARSLAAVEALTTSWARPQEQTTYSSPITPTQTTQAVNGPNVYVELEGSRGPEREIAEMEAVNKVEPVSATETKEKENPLAPITNILRSASAVGSKDPKPVKAKRSKQRVELDDFDSDEEQDDGNPFDETNPSTQSLSDLPPVEGQHAHQNDRQPQENLTIAAAAREGSAKDLSPGSNNTSIEDNDTTPTGPRSPLPSSATSVTGEPTPHAETTHAEPTTSRNPSLDSTDTTSSSVLTPNNFSSSTMSQQSWSDTSLRSWLDDGSEVKDMLVMINDKSGVVPVDHDHPLMAGLFVDSRKGVENMMDQLDGLLSDFLQRKGIVLA